MIIKKQITLHDSESLDRYFNEIRDIPTLNKVEEHELIRKYQQEGDEKALDKVVKANLKFVVSVAKKYQGQGAPLSDLISEANIGLLDAVRNFDLTREVKVKLFSYAVWRMDIYIRKRLELNKRLVQLPANREILMNKVKLAVLDLENQLTRHPTHAEVVAYVKQRHDLTASEGDVADALNHALRVRSFSEPVGEKVHEGEDLELELHLPGNMDTDQEDLGASRLQELGRYLLHLQQLEYDVLVLALGLNAEPQLRNQDIAKLLKLKVADVPRVKHGALKRLRKLHRIEALKDHL